MNSLDHTPKQPFSLMADEWFAEMRHFGWPDVGHSELLRFIKRLLRSRVVFTDASTRQRWTLESSINGVLGDLIRVSRKAAYF